MRLVFGKCSMRKALKMLDLRIGILALFGVVFAFVLSPMLCSPAQREINKPRGQQTLDSMNIGPCIWVLNQTCPSDYIEFYLFTRHNMMDRQKLYISDTLRGSNITSSHFDPSHPTKIIIHGYNSDMYLNNLIAMKDEYLQKGNYNLIYVDWSVLGLAPCYFSAVHNTRHTGMCVAQLVERIVDMGAKDIHMIGFSLGAQLMNYVALNLENFTIPRITGLDPALPLFITSQINEKLDPSDAQYVDVIHTNALVQGKLERCGHADFYINGGIFQPGCTGNIFACSHQRAPAYFMESIRTTKGFWGWPCSSYVAYLLGMCPPTNYLVEAGENIDTLTQGLFLITTAGETPFALGKWTEIRGERQNLPASIMHPTGVSKYGPLLQEVDEWGKLEGSFNNLDASAESDEDPYEVNRRRSEVTSLRSKKWSMYRNNLSVGYIDKSVFQVPKFKFDPAPNGKSYFLWR